MKSIDVLKEKILDKDITVRAYAVEQLVKISSEGNEKANKLLCAALKNESDISVLQKVFEKPISSKNIICILDILSSSNSTLTLLYHIIFDAVSYPNNYSSNFTEMFVYFLKNSHQFNPIAIQTFGTIWAGHMPPAYKEAIRLYFYNEMENLYLNAKKTDQSCNSLISFPEKHPLLLWLEGVERGAITSSHPSYSALQSIAEGLGLYLNDTVVQIETADPSPITLERQKQERKEEGLEFLPIDKLLGQYFPEDKRIILYKQEIIDIAYRLNVNPETLKRIVVLHESAHAIVHLGKDADKKNFNTKAYCMVYSGSDPSPLHETLAQLLCYHCVKDHSKLLECFEKLNEHQPPVYNLWERFKDIGLERVRAILIDMREAKVEASYEKFKELALQKQPRLIFDCHESQISESAECAFAELAELLKDTKAPTLAVKTKYVDQLKDLKAGITKYISLLEEAMDSARTKAELLDLAVLKLLEKEDTKTEEKP